LKDLKNIWKLTKSGAIEKEKRNPKQMFLFILKMLLFFLVLKIISISLFFLLNWVDEVPENLSRLKFRELNDVEILFLTAVYAPILEEIAFRLPLKFSKWNVSIAAAGLTLIAIRVFSELDYLYSLLISIGIGFILFISLTKKKTAIGARYWKNNRAIIFYLLLFSFSILHLKNYTLTTELLLISPLILLPKILDGILFSYIRLNSGILLAICLHSFNNSFFKLASMLIN